MRLTKTYDDRYTELITKYWGGQWETPLHISVQGTERSMTPKIAGTITSRLASGHIGVLVRYETD